MRLLNLFSGNLINTSVVPENSRAGFLKKHDFSNMIGLSLIVFGFVFGPLTARAEMGVKEQVKVLNRSKSIKNMSVALKMIFRSPEDHRQIDKDAKAIAKMAAKSSWRYEVKGKKEIAFRADGRVYFTFRPVDINRGKFLFNGRKFVINPKLSYEQHKARMSKILKNQTAGLEQFFINEAHAGWLLGRKAKAEEKKTEDLNGAVGLGGAAAVTVGSCGEGEVFQRELEAYGPGNAHHRYVNKCIKEADCKGEWKVENMSDTEVSAPGEAPFSYKGCVRVKNPQASAGDDSGSSTATTEEGTKTCTTEQKNNFRKECIKNQHKDEYDPNHPLNLNYSHFEIGELGGETSSPPSAETMEGLQESYEKMKSKCGSGCGQEDGECQKGVGKCADEVEEALKKLAKIKQNYDEEKKGCETDCSDNDECQSEIDGCKAKAETNKNNAIGELKTSNPLVATSADSGNGAYGKCVKDFVRYQNAEERCKRPGYVKIKNADPSLTYLGERLDKLIEKSEDRRGEGLKFNKTKCMNFAKSDPKAEGWGMIDKYAKRYCNKAGRLYNMCLSASKNCESKVDEVEYDEKGDHIDEEPPDVIQ